METIGLNINEMSDLMISIKMQLAKDQEGNLQATTEQLISDGFTEDEARFRAGLIGMQTVDVSAILGIIVENNRRILSELKKAGILNS